MNNFIEFVQSWTGGGKYAIILFPVIVGLLLLCSLKIVKYSLVIINKTKFGAGFFGATIIALITSLPELITEITQANAGNPENGLGDDIGSNAFSTFLIGVGALIFIRRLFLNDLSKWTKISIVLSFAMSIILTISLFLIDVYEKDVNLKIIGIIPMVLFLFYLLTIYLSNKYGGEELIQKESGVGKIPLNKAIVLFVIFSMGVVMFSVFLNVDVSAFQRGYSIKSDSIGGLVLASVTSLPEVVAFFVFLKKKESTMAITSLTGSHFFNLGIIFIGDLVYTNGPSFNKPEMLDHLYVGVLNSIMLFLLILHFTLASKIKLFKKNKFVYSALPFIMVLGYVVGWSLILTLN